MHILLSVLYYYHCQPLTHRNTSVYLYLSIYLFIYIYLTVDAHTHHFVLLYHLYFRCIITLYYYYILCTTSYFSSSLDKFMNSPFHFIYIPSPRLIYRTIIRWPVIYTSTYSRDYTDTRDPFTSTKLTSLSSPTFPTRPIIYTWILLFMISLCPLIFSYTHIYIYIYIYMFIYNGL